MYDIAYKACLYTGVVLNLLIVWALIVSIMEALYQMLGATIMMWRILRFLKKSDKKWGGSRVIWDIFKFWFGLAFKYRNRGSFKFGKLLQVKWPRPWYRPDHDEHDEHLPA